MNWYLHQVKGFFELLNKHQVEYMIIGGVAVNVHGYSRATGDLDIWYHPTDENFLNLLRAVKDFGFDTSEVEGLMSDPQKALLRLPLDNLFIECLANIDGKLNYADVYAQTYNFTVVKRQIERIYQIQ